MLDLTVWAVPAAYPRLAARLAPQILLWKAPYPRVGLGGLPDHPKPGYPRDQSLTGHLEDGGSGGEGGTVLTGRLGRMGE
jgi:hypothetical protein